MAKAITTTKPFSYFPYAFLSAYTTLPTFQQSGKFFLESIENIFSQYQKGLNDMQNAAHHFQDPQVNKTDRFLYKPIPYCLFGEFDIAVFSLIDDFSFATKQFKPQPQSPGFKYQVNTGIIPLIDAYTGRGLLSKFRHRLLPSFFSNTRKYPFTGIASVKLNNSMLVGTGQAFLDLINFFFITYLDQAIEKQKSKGLRLFYIINENLGWNEQNIYFFGNSMTAIQELIMYVRQFRLRDIKEYLEGLVHADKFNVAKINKDILPIFNDLRENSLLASLIAKKKKKGTIDFLESHPVIATSITYGFRYELIALLGNKEKLEKEYSFTKKEYDIFLNECNRPEAISMGWKIKPGHEDTADKLIRKCFPKNAQKVYDGRQTGKYPFTFPKELISFAAYINFARRGAEINKQVKSKHVIKLRSLLHWSAPSKVRSYTANLHYNHNLSKFRITEDEANRIQQKLCLYPVPYTFKNQIENLIINYNDAVSDPLMYSYFIGLKYSLLNFLNEKFGKDLFKSVKKLDRLQISLIKSAPLGVLGHRDEKPTVTMNMRSLDIESISAFIQNWNKGYWNRYFHSYYFTEINDFNIEHHGGIQQLLFTYDTFYRLINRRVYGKQSTEPFVNVQVGPMIVSTQFYNTINFIHLFRPAIYACECVHEAVNHIIPFLVQNYQHKEYEFLFNPLNGQIDFDNEKVQAEFEARLRKKVGPRDASESRYINDHFGLNAIRHIVADFSTYVLGYLPFSKAGTPPSWTSGSLDTIRLFYHAHWFLFLIRSDLYCREELGNGAWFFKESDFQALFMRFNLMFYLFLDLNRTQLGELNKECPSIELKALWECERNRLLDLVFRLGDALKQEFKTQLEEFPDIRLKSRQTAIGRFRDTIVTKVFDQSWGEMELEDQKAFRHAIELNQELIKGFHDFFSEKEHKYNIVVRRSSMAEHPLTNISFHPLSHGRTIFLDPKGHLFLTSPKSRKDIFRKNVEYIKRMWDLALNISLRDYKSQHV